MAFASVLAGLGIILLVFGIISLNTAPPDAQSVDSQSPDAATSTATEEPTTPRPGTTYSPTAPAVLPVTVLNNSPVEGLASRVAGVLEAGGWPITELLNYSDTQIPSTTVFFTPGVADEQAAALALVSQFPQIAGGAEPRFDGLDGSGLTLAAVGDWLP